MTKDKSEALESAILNGQKHNEQEHPFVTFEDRIAYYRATAHQLRDLLGAVADMVGTKSKFEADFIEEEVYNNLRDVLENVPDPEKIHGVDVIAEYRKTVAKYDQELPRFAQKRAERIDRRHATCK